MKFIEKKCPNCGANLKFEPGDRDARCESCRREFIIQHNADDIADDIKEVTRKLRDQVDDFNLIPATKLFGSFFAIHTIVVTVISIVIIGFVAFGIVHAVISFNQSKEEHQKREADMSEEFQKNVEKMNEQIDEAQKRFEDNKQSHDTE